MRFIQYLCEMEGEGMPRESSIAAKMASELLKGAGGDPNVAKKMANSFLEQLMDAIDDQGMYSSMKHAGGGRPQAARPQQRPTGHEQSGGQSTGFRGYA